MAPVLIDLNPNRLLLDPNFEGYKLSLAEIPRKTFTLPVEIDRVLLDSTQYSLLHAKLFGLHNHLIGDPFEENSIYFIDVHWNINKIYVDPLGDDLIEPVQVWRIPKNRNRRTGDYNVSMKFISSLLAVVSDGMGLLYILETGERNNDGVFTVSFADEITGEEEKAFVILDGVLTETGQELHVLLQSIEQQKVRNTEENSRDQFSAVLHWIRFAYKDGKWNQTALRRLKVNGTIQYAAFEENCEAIYVASDKKCRFILNSDCPVVEELSQPDCEEVKKVYTWTQTIEDICIKIVMPEELKKEQVQVITEPTKISIKYDSNVLICGDLHHRIDSEMTTWSVKGKELEVNLSKHETGLMWPEFVKNDQTGEEVLNTCIVEQVHEKLAHLCSENEDMPQNGTTFNSQQIEECDFETDKSTIFERLNGINNSVTHRINLGSHQVLLTANLYKGLPPALGIRHDVDVCLWQPHGRGDDFCLSHEGTLLAFGYVQASKQNRKFSVCPPDMDYSAICESSGHIFIYRQQKAVTSGELRNRTTGKKVVNIAEQQVVNIPNEEILGVCPFNTFLYILTNKSITALKLY